MSGTIREDQFVVYHRAPWRHSLIFNLYPGARRIPADFDDRAPQILARVPADARFFLYHIDLTNSAMFPQGRAELTAALRARGIEVLNSDLTDTSKPYIHQACIRAGINCPRADRDGDGDELIMVKTAANCGGASERKLGTGRRRQLGVTEPHDEIMHTHLYKVFPRRAIQDEWWNDPRLSFDRYINNRENRMWRIAFFLDHLMLTEYAAPGYCKKLDRYDYRLNSFGRWSADGIELSEKNCDVPPGLVTEFVGITGELGLRFGSLDFVRDDLGNYYVIDVNPTPAGARILPVGSGEHLRRALPTTDRSRRGIGRWLRIGTR